jgi:hypothetical protein
VQNALLISLFGALIFAADAPSDALHLEIVPASLDLASCSQPTRLLVIARNQGSRTLTRFELSSFSDVPVNLVPALPLQLVTIAPGDQRSWLFDVTCATAFPAGSLHFVASARTTESGAAVSRIATQSVAVKLRVPDSLDSIVAVDIKSSLESLTQGVNGAIIVAATNKTALPVIIKITPQPLASVHLDPPTVSANGTQIGSGQTQTFTFTATAQSRVTPGKQLLLFDVQVWSGGAWRNYLITREVSVGVLGESEMLKLLGVPSFLFLPGFLVMTTFSLLWRFRVFRPATADPKLPLDEKDPGFWVISIILSAAILFGFVRRRSDFLSFYGLVDVAHVWLVSIGIGGAAYLLRQWWVGSFIPQPGDHPVKILKKLGRARQGMAVPRVKLKDSTKEAFRLKSYSDGSACVCPQMTLTWKKGAGGAVRDNVEKQLTRQGKPGEVVKAISQDRKSRDKSQIASLLWDESDARNSSPHIVTAEGIERYLEAPDIILAEKEEA